MLGNAVNIDVIDYLLRPTIMQLRADPATSSRPWVLVSLFNGIDGFLLGFESACEALWLIQELTKHRENHDEGSDDDDLTEGQDYIMRTGPASSIPLEATLLRMCLHDLKVLFNEHNLRREFRWHDKDCTYLLF